MERIDRNDQRYHDLHSCVPCWCPWRGWPRDERSANRRNPSIVEAHGGRSVLGDWPGRGAEFLLLFPRGNR
jgi:hypothetical protein